MITRPSGLRLAMVACLLAAPTVAVAQSLPASPASSTEKPGKEETAPRKDDTGLIITASSRLRFETVDGRPRPGYAVSEDALQLRTGVAVEYGPGPVAIGGELIDSRAYSLRTGTQIGRDDVDAVELPQIYVKARLDSGFGPAGKVSVQGGRFLMNFGASRLVGTDEYRNTVNGFTGARLDLGFAHDREATFFYTLPQERLPDAQADIDANKVVFDRETWDDQFFGAHLQQKKVAGGTLELSWFRLVERDSPGRSTADRRLHTLDARLSRDAKAGTFDYDVEGAYQFGSASDGTTATATHYANVSAGFAHGSAGYTFGGPFKPRVGVFYDYASGDGRGGTFGRFDTLFGSRRDDLGPSGTYAALARTNISAPGVRFEAKPGERLEFLSDVRGVWLASRYDQFYMVTDKTGRSGDYAGTQVEGRLRYWLIPKHLRWEGNYALLYKGDFLKNAPQAIAKDHDLVRLIETNLQVTF
jgi:hypothetical protein